MKIINQSYSNLLIPWRERERKGVRRREREGTGHARKRHASLDGTAVIKGLIVMTSGRYVGTISSSKYLLCIRVDYGRWQADNIMQIIVKYRYLAANKQYKSSGFPSTE